MKKITSLALLFLACTFLLMNCKKEIEGCTDVDSENFNAEATVNVGCVYARDKFIGSYKGTLSCPGALNIINGETTLAIDEDIAGGKNDVTVLITTNTGLSIPIKGTCEGDKLSIDAVVKDVTVTILGAPQKMDITAKGSVNFKEADKSLEGTLNLVTSFFGLGDNCPIVAKRQ
ncbi:MAG: hypothetical protein RLZZ546_1324 [Bacteroidota bacterium]